MRKSEELSNPNSCINKSQDQEWLFVLCARDPHAPVAVRKWADEYEAAGGKPGKVAEARACADRMDAWRESRLGDGTPVVEAGGPPAQLPRWKCHKEVYAAKIGDIERGSDGAAVLWLRIDGEIGMTARADIDAAWLDRHQPEVGGYFVQYEDGYKSYSPALAFESGYTRIGGAP